jgi:hypothetical protein
MRRSVDFPIPAAPAKTTIGSGRRRISAIKQAGLRTPIEVLVDEGNGGDMALWLSSDGEAANNLVSACDMSPSRVAVCVDEEMISVASRRVEETLFPEAAVLSDGSSLCRNKAGHSQHQSPYFPGMTALAPTKPLNAGPWFHKSVLRTAYSAAISIRSNGFGRPTSRQLLRMSRRSERALRRLVESGHIHDDQCDRA